MSRQFSTGWIFQSSYFTFVKVCHLGKQYQIKPFPLLYIGLQNGMINIDCTAFQCLKSFYHIFKNFQTKATNILKAKVILH